MKTARLALFALAIAAPSAVLAQDDGPLQTLPVGQYQCSVPGDAAGRAWIPIEGKVFTIKNASRYLSPEGTGIYLMTGDELIFTRGPMKNQRFRRMGSTILRMKEADGSLGRVRCVRVG